MKPTLIMTLLASAGLAQAAMAGAPTTDNTCACAVATNVSNATCGDACCGACAVSDGAPKQMKIMMMGKDGPMPSGDMNHMKMMMGKEGPMPKGDMSRMKKMMGQMGMRGGSHHDAKGDREVALAFTITIDDDGNVSIHGAKPGDAPHAKGHMNWRGLAESLGRMGGNSFSFGDNDNDDDAPHAFVSRETHKQAGDDDDDNDRPRLGVMLEPEADGLEIAELIDGMPAARSGLKEGDVIVRINGDDDVNLDELREALDASKIKLDVDREGKTDTFVIELQDDNDDAPNAYSDDTGRAHSGADRDDKNFDFDFDGDTMEQIHNAIVKALSSQSLHLDGNAKEALAKALGAMGDSKRNEAKEGGRMRMRMRPDQKPHAAAKDAEARMQVTLDRAHARVEREKQRVEKIKEAFQKAREKSADARNPEIDKRLKSLEERMERIEVLLEKLAQHG